MEPEVRDLIDQIGRDYNDLRETLTHKAEQAARAFVGKRLDNVESRLDILTTFGTTAGGPAHERSHPFLFSREVREAAIAETRAISSSHDPSGGYLLTVDQNLLYAPLLVAPSAAQAAGIRFIPSGTAEVKVPTETTDPTAYWVPEAGEITESTPQWGALNVIPRKLAALVAVPNELLQAGETSPETARLVESRMARALSGELDRAIFEGDGVGEPLGLRDTDGINEVPMATDGATFSNLDPFADAIAELLEDNAEPGAIVLHPRDWRNLSKLKEATSGNNKPLLQNSAGSGGQPIQRSIYGLPVLLTSRLSTTEVQGASAAVCSSAYVIGRDAAVFVQRLSVQLAVSGARLFNRDMSEIRAVLRGNLAVLQPTGICRIRGIKAS